MEKKLHILIAEDDSRTRMFLADYFREKGHVVFPVGNGLEGLRILEGQVIDLVITDYTMPFMNGKEFVLHIKKNNPHLPVILVSGFGHQAKKDLQLLKEHFYAYIEKPIPLALLYSAVQKIQQENHDE